LQATQLTIEPNPINDVEFNIDGTSAFTTIPIPLYKSASQLTYELVLLSFVPMKVRLL
jgi:hypothetical protein